MYFLPECIRTFYVNLKFTFSNNILYLFFIQKLRLNYLYVIILQSLVFQNYLYEKLLIKILIMWEAFIYMTGGKILHKWLPSE